MSLEATSGDEVALAEQEHQRDFLALYGSAMVASVHLQYRLADIYSVYFEDARAASLPRVHEKWHQAVDGTLGQAFNLAEAALTPALRARTRAAVDLRNYLAHWYILETRQLQGSVEGLIVLAGPLKATMAAFQEVGEELRLHNRQVLTDAHAALTKAGANLAPLDFDAHLVEWSQFEQPESVPTPKDTETICAAHLAPHPNGTSIILESDAGQFWQLVEVGLAHANVDPTERASWKPLTDLQAFLPATVTSRPKRKSTAYRSPFNYDLEFSTGAILSLETDGSNAAKYEVKKKA